MAHHILNLVLMLVEMMLADIQPSPLHVLAPVAWPAVCAAAAALIGPYSQLFGNFRTLPEARRGSCTARAGVGGCGCEHRAMLPASWQAFMAYSLVNVYGFGGSFAYSFLETHAKVCVRASRPASATECSCHVLFRARAAFWGMGLFALARIERALPA